MKTAAKINHFFNFLTPIISNFITIKKLKSSKTDTKNFNISSLLKPYQTYTNQKFLF